MSPSMGIEPRATDVHALHTTVFTPSDPYVVMLYWFQNIYKSKNQYSMTLMISKGRIYNL